MFNKDNIARIDFTEGCGNTYKVDMIALYNITKISEDEVKKAIEIKDLEENENIIFMTKKQFNNVFISQ